MGSRQTKIICAHSGEVLPYAKGTPYERQVLQLPGTYKTETCDSPARSATLNEPQPSRGPTPRSFDCRAPFGSENHSPQSPAPPHRQPPISLGFGWGALAGNVFPCAPTQAEPTAHAPAAPASSSAGTLLLPKSWPCYNFSPEPAWLHQLRAVWCFALAFRGHISRCISRQIGQLFFVCPMATGCHSTEQR